MSHAFVRRSAVLSGVRLTITPTMVVVGEVVTIGVLHRASQDLATVFLLSRSSPRMASASMEQSLNATPSLSKQVRTHSLLRICPQ